LRAQLVGTVMEPLNATFADLAAAMDGSSGALAESQPIQDLVAILRNTPVSAMLIADSSKVSNDNDVSPMLDFEPLQVGLATSARCNNFTDNSSGSNVVIPGISNFVDRLAGLGPKLPSGGSCVQNVDCAGSQDQVACAAGNAYVDLKRTLVQDSPRLYRCDVFEASSGQPCDPKEMARDVSGRWINDCLIADGSKVTTRVKQVECNLDEFTAYVQSYEQRVLKVLGRLDNATAETSSLIVDDLHHLVTRYILDPIFHIVNGVTCGFMPDVFRGFLNGFCFQGVIGFRTMGASYVVFAVSVLVMALAMYFQWRLAIDNVNAECDAQYIPNDAHQSAVPEQKYAEKTDAEEVAQVADV